MTHDHALPRPFRALLLDDEIVVRPCRDPAQVCAAIAHELAHYAAKRAKLCLAHPDVWRLALAILVVLTFVPFNVMHPLRTTRFRMLNIALLMIWGVLAVYAIVLNFQTPVWVTAALCIIGGYILLSDVLIRSISGTRT